MKPADFVAFRVDGVPVTQGSMLAFADGQGKPRVRHHAGPALEEWRRAIGWAAREAGARLTTHGVAIEATYWLPRPLQPAHDYPQGDLDKFVRATLDALSRVAYVDDVQVVELVVRKAYAEPGFPPGLDVTIRPWVSYVLATSEDDAR